MFELLIEYAGLVQGAALWTAACLTYVICKRRAVR